MVDGNGTSKQQQENKIRCSQFLLDMIEKYGAAILDEIEEGQNQRHKGSQGRE